jgi:TonB-linked SusC/RagA family outer membrane protein
MKNLHGILSIGFLFSTKQKCKLTSILLLFMFFWSSILVAQNNSVIKGRVLDNKEEPLIGATVMVKGLPKSSAVTDVNGQFSISVPSGKNTLVISYISYQPQEVNISGKNTVKVVMAESGVKMDELVVVGYGQQKKQSLVGAISQTSGKTLERTGGVSSLGQALTGNLPGVITNTSSGMPGAEDPKIIIRTASSWNNSDPLIMVDGVERSMSTVDIASVESISVLKDASATAVYGVKGANGVILITTKRGSEGKASVQIRANMTTKSASKLPAKYDSYDALSLRNRAIMNEIGISPSAWSSYKPMDIINKYRYPANQQEWDQYPNVDWEEELFKNSTTSSNLSANVSGGSKVVKYFAAVDYTHEGDLFKTFENGRGYESGYGYNRINVRSNLDFNLTPTTKFSSNLFGSNGVRKLPWGAKDDDTQYWSSAYRTASDAMRPVYSDGTYGFYSPRNADVPNSVSNLAISGIEQKTTTQLSTDFTLNQQLDMLTKGLSIKVSLSLDNTFKEKERGVNDLYKPIQRKWVDPETGVVTYEQPLDAGTRLDYTDPIAWSNQGGAVDKDATYRKIYYTAQVNYARNFGKHNVSALGLFSRDKSATGSEFFHFREDWVFRATYNYDSKYLFETSGAYNGSEKFGANNRFAFFPSLSAGWLITEENFMKPLKFVDMLKLRASWGKIGDDNVKGRWLYNDQWSYGGNAQMGSPASNTIYNFYRIGSLGNQNISWETVEKRNYALDYSFFNGLLAGSVDVFNDHRTDILIGGGSRSIPSYFGATAPTANLGSVKSKGYELELRFNKVLAKDVRVWVNTSMTHAVNKVEFRDDPELKPTYQKQADHTLGQYYSYIDKGYLKSWDDVVGSTARLSNNAYKIVGDYNIIDFNGDGVIDSNDSAPYQYSGTPQNTYNATIGFELKGFSCYFQFYGVNNVTREVTFPTFKTYSGSNVAYVEGSYYQKGIGGDHPLPRWATDQGGDASGTRYLFDGSYVRLKNVEIAYTLSNKWVKQLGVRSCKIYLNGNNLWVWTKMPDDRESNFSGGSSSGQYPTVKRVNMGIDITL